MAGNVERTYWVVFNLVVHEVIARTPGLAAKIVVGSCDPAGVVVSTAPPNAVFVGRCGRCQQLIADGDLMTTRTVGRGKCRRPELRCEDCP